MEQQTIAALLEKYWLAETTVEEEKILAAYFRQSEIAPEWESCRQLFAYYEEEAKVVPGEDLGNRIMERIRELEGGPGIVRQLRHRLKWSYAAAAIVILGVSLFLMYPALTRNDQPQGVVGSGKSLQGLISDTDTGVRAGNGASVSDTYEDPQQALAAIQKALLTVSVKMNQGKHLTQQHMDRLNDSWNSAIAN